jgi:hypothetical protein
VRAPKMASGPLRLAAPTRGQAYERFAPGIGQASDTVPGGSPLPSAALRFPFILSLRVSLRSPLNVRDRRRSSPTSLVESDRLNDVLPTPLAPRLFVIRNS